MLGRLIRFAGVSGAGLLLDYAIYTVLCEVGLHAAVANLISAGCAVTFVFVVSVHHVFERPDGHMLMRPFAVYVAYQVVAVGAASAAVGALTDALDGRYLLGKTLVVPVSFLANFLFMSWLLNQRRWAVTE